MFASGTLLLDGDTKPLQPAVLEVLGPCQVRLTLYEGVITKCDECLVQPETVVNTLHRSAIGGLVLDGLPEGQWRVLEAQDLAMLFSQESR